MSHNERQEQQKKQPAPPAGGALHSLYAGVAQVEITPPLGTHLAGGINTFRSTQKVVDPLYAKALVLEAGPAAVSAE